MTAEAATPTKYVNWEMYSPQDTLRLMPVTVRPCMSCWMYTRPQTAMTATRKSSHM